MNRMIELAERLDSFDQKLRSIAANENLTPGGQGAAISLLVSLNMTLFSETAAALRARATLGDSTP